MQLAPLVILVVVRELFRLGLDVMELFLAPIPFDWQGKELLLCQCLIEFAKTGFILVFALWIVKTVVLPGLDMTLFARQSFSILRSFMSAVSPDVRYFHVISWLFVFMGCLWGGPGSDFLVLLWSCPPNSYAVTVPKTRWSLPLQKWWGIWVVRPFLQIGCVVVTVSASFCLAGGVTSMLFTIS